MLYFLKARMSQMICMLPTIAEGCMSVDFYIGIVYIMPKIGGICVSCWVSVGPSGPGWGDVCQSWLIHWYCRYHTNERGKYVSWFIHGIVYYMPSVQ